MISDSILSSEIPSTGELKIVSGNTLEPDEIRAVLEGQILLHLHSNIERLEVLGENLGYPVLLMTMSAMQYIATICASGIPNVDPLDAYCDRFMKRVDERYGVKFTENLMKVGKDGERLCLQESGRAYTNVGTILRELLRNRLTHSCGTLLEIDARMTMEPYHLCIKKTSIDGCLLFVHAYKLYHDYRKSLLHLYKDLADDENLLARTSRALGSEWAAIILMKKAMDRVITQHLSGPVSDLYPKKLVCLDDAFAKLQELGQSQIDH